VLQFGGHHRLEDYARRGAEPKDEVQVYTWPDATLRELTDLVKEVQPAARRSTARLDFALVYPDKRGRNVMRVVRLLHAELLGMAWLTPAGALRVGAHAGCAWRRLVGRTPRGRGQMMPRR
jgi:3-phenylpropionate/cinnamic acid dioxygenase small subunit